MGKREIKPGFTYRIFVPEIPEREELNYLCDLLFHANTAGLNHRQMLETQVYHEPWSENDAMCFVWREVDNSEAILHDGHHKLVRKQALKDFIRWLSDLDNCIVDYTESNTISKIKRQFENSFNPFN